MCLILHIEYARAERVWRDLQPAPSNPHYPGRRARVLGRVADRSALRHILSRGNRRRMEQLEPGSVERQHEMNVGSTDTVKNAPPPRDPGTALPKLVTEFNEAVDRSTTSND